MKYSLPVASMYLAAALIAGGCTDRTGRSADSPRSVTGMVDGPAGGLFYEMYHPDAEGVPLLMIHGGPGSTSCSFGLLDERITDRPVIRYDQTGTGRSEGRGAASSYPLHHFVAEIDSIRAALDLDRLHIMGLSWGGSVAIEYALHGDTSGVASITLSGPLVSTSEWIKDAVSLVEELPPDLQSVIRRHEAAGTFDDPEYLAATDSFYVRFLYRRQPPPQIPECSGVSGNSDIYTTMWGPSEFTATGTLLDYDRADRLQEIRLPVLFIGGEFDEARPETLREFAATMPDARVEIVEGAAHMTVVDRPEQFAELLESFMSEHEPHGR
ncbi:MAG: proline iminopeptidase-family hydrolase [Rhodothermales bacterium]|nr:proline iminopeptidase-family hydrolase [Rhodothermales bacterium]